MFQNKTIFTSNIKSMFPQCFNFRKSIPVVNGGRFCIYCTSFKFSKYWLISNIHKNVDFVRPSLRWGSPHRPSGRLQHWNQLYFQINLPTPLLGKTYKFFLPVNYSECSIDVLFRHQCFTRLNCTKNAHNYIRALLARCA